MYRTCKAHYLSDRTPCPVCRIDELIAEKEVMTKHIEAVQRTWDGCDSERQEFRAEIRRLEEALDSNVLLQQIRALEGEIEKLKDDAIHNEGVMVALKEGYSERGEEIERLEAKLTEQLQHLQRITAERGYHITDEMIDKAVEYATAVSDPAFEVTHWELLNKLHIYRCEGCGGSGVCPMPGEDFISNVGQPAKCPACDGHGWIIKK